MNQQARMTKECPMPNDQGQRKLQVPKEQKSNSLFAPLRPGAFALKNSRSFAQFASFPVRDEGEEEDENEVQMKLLTGQRNACPLGSRATT